MSENRTGIGARVLRKEDERLLNGRGRFIDDLAFPRLLEAAFWRSPVAHGRIARLDVPADLAGSVFAWRDMAGVRPITARSTLPGYQVSDYAALADGVVRFVGEPVAVAVAPTRAEAEDRVARLAPSIDELPPLADVRSALASRTPLHPGWKDNLFIELKRDDDFAALEGRVAHVVRREFRMNRQSMSPMEGKAVLALWDDQRNQLVVYSSTQVPHMIRSGLAECLGLPLAQLRVIAPDVGGGFGYKCNLMPEEVAIAWLALKLKRPVRWVEDRREHLVAGTNCREHQYRMAAHVDARGRLLGLEAEVWVDSGAYSVWPFTACLETGQIIGNLPGPYKMECYRCTVQGVATNKPPFSPYRGVARPGVAFAMEMMMDAIARTVGRDPTAVRFENLVTAADMPYTNIARKAFDTGDYPSSLTRVMEMLDHAGFAQRQAEARKEGRYLGIGFATYTEQAAHGTSVFASWGLPIVPGYDGATVKLTADGTLEVKVGVHSHGQGMETSLAQIASELTTLPLEAINVIHGDTGETPFSTGTYASRSIVMAGGAVSKACEVLMGRARTLAAALGKCDAAALRLEGGAFRGAGVTVSLKDIGEAWFHRPERLPAAVPDGGLEVTEHYKPAVDTGVFSFASHGAVVEVDIDTGNVRLVDYVIAEDCGTLVNPMIVDGQTIGGAVQGIGTALFEEMPYDAAAQPLASTYADYLLPGASEMPHIRIAHSETPSPHTRHGIKGVGEGGAIAPPAAILNAVNRALAEFGVEFNETPLTPRRLLAAVLAARRARAAAPLKEAA
ncbi:MAG: xanthine dehydrogenase family protein [Burkholderiales bacterium]|nr:xanthine dehydrogenase family protein [Burkholderiales bacterium]